MRNKFILLGDEMSWELENKLNDALASFGVICQIEENEDGSSEVVFYDIR